MPHTFSEDGIIRFGDTVLLQHDLSSSVLACDPFDEIFPGLQKYHVSASSDVSPVARSAFKVLRPPSHLKNYEDDENDPVLHIGQPFCLGCNESLLVAERSNLLSPQLYLCSTLKNERASTRISNRQIVYLSANNDAESVWFVMLPSSGKTASYERTLAVGAPVYNEDTFIVSHRQTNSFLTVDASHKELTDFGPEFECFAEHSNTNGKLFLIQSEFKGLTTSSSLVKADIPNNLWHFVTASESNAGIETRNLPPVATVETIFDDLYSYARSLGIDGFSSLRHLLHQLDKTSGGDGKVDKGDVKRALYEWGCAVESRFLDMALEELNQYNSLVDYKEFMRILRGPIADSRRNMVAEVFSKLDTMGQGTIPSDLLLERFHAEQHPLVLEGKLKLLEATNQLKAYFFSKGRVPSTIRYVEFEEYFADLSACVESDDEFSMILSGIFSG